MVKAHCVIIAQNQLFLLLCSQFHMCFFGWCYCNRNYCKGQETLRMSRVWKVDDNCFGQTSLTMMRPSPKCGVGMRDRVTNYIKHFVHSNRMHGFHQIQGLYFCSMAFSIPSIKMVPAPLG